MEKEKIKSKNREYHHHKGYEKENRLNVIPLCIPCHRQVHVKEEVVNNE